MSESLAIRCDDATELSATVSGEPGGTPVVLLHGLTATRRYVVMGSSQLERSGHRVVAYDARGHGRSSPAPEPGAYGYPRLAGDLGAVLDAAGFERAVLAGASMGAHTLLRFALAEPDRVAGLVVVTPAYLPDVKVDMAHWRALADGLRDGGADGFLAAYETGSIPERWRGTVRTVIRQRLAQHEHPEAVADALRTVPRSRPFEDLAELGGIAAPVAIVASRDEADPEHPYAVAVAYHRAMPHARLLSEDPGESPLAWRGAQLSRIIAEVAAQAAG